MEIIDAESMLSFVDILKEKREKSDILWATRPWKGTVAYQPPQKFNPEKIKSAVLNSRRLLRTVSQMRQVKQLPLDLLFTTAKKILDEIGCQKEISILRWLALVVSKLLKKLYSAVYVNETKFLKIKYQMGSTPVLFLPSHKSYCDFVLMSFICFNYEVDIPRIAAGIDFESMAIMGTVLRNSGAFFMRRSFTNDELYSAVFSQYVQTLVTKGDAPIEFFIEGTRSRTGKSLTPKYGFLSMALKPFFTGLVSDITLIPVSMSYERVLEEILFAYELLGIPKPKESTMGFLKALTILNENYGNTYVRFGDPFSVKQYFGKAIDRSVHGFGSVHLQELTSNESTQITGLAHTIIRKQKELFVLNCFNLICAVLINYFIEQTQFPDVIDLVTEVEWLHNALKNIAPESSTTAIKVINKDVIVHHLNLHKNLMFLSNKKIGLCRIHKSDSEVNPAKLKGHNLSNNTMEVAIPLLVLQFYANPCVCFLVGVCFLVVIVRSRTSENFIFVEEMCHDFQFLCSIFSHEFVFHPDFIHKDFKEAFEHCEKLKLLQVDRDKVTRGSNEKFLQFCINILNCYIPGYLNVIEFLLQSNALVFKQKEIIKECQRVIEEKINSGFIVHPGILSLELPMNALQGLVSVKAISKVKSKNETNGTNPTAVTDKRLKENREESKGEKEYHVDKGKLNKVYHKLSNHVKDHDWQHCWYDPDHFGNLMIKECVKGPFAEPKLMCDLPVVMYSQKNQIGSKGRTPYYSVRALRCSCQKLCPSDDTMFTNDTCPLRRQYGLHIGHGIPDPWMWPPVDAFIPTFGDLKTEVKRYVNRLSKGQSTADDPQHRAFLDKKYFFECPDNAAVSNVSMRNNVTPVFCPDYQEGSVCGDNCRCIQILQNWIMENAHLLKSRDENHKSECCDPKKKVPPTKVCICQNISDVSFSENEELPEKRNNEPVINSTKLRSAEQEVESKIPYNLQNTACGNEKTEPKCEGRRCLKKKKVSTSTQTEAVKETGKTKPGEHEKHKCQCDEKCSECLTYKCAHNLPVTSNLCLPFQNSPFSCPYFHPGHFMVQNSSLTCTGSRSKTKKERRTSARRRKAEESSEGSNGSCQLKSQMKEECKKDNWDKFKPAVCLPQPSISDFNQLKYLTDRKLKNYFMRKELSNNFFYPGEPPSDVGPKFTDLYEDKEPKNGTTVKKCPTYFHCDFDKTLKKFFPEDIMKYHRKLEAPPEERTKETKVEFIKELESDESNTYGLVRNFQGSRRTIWKRRQLRANRKRRKNLASLKPSTSEKPPKYPNRVNKNIQVDESFQEVDTKQRQTHFNFKKVSFDVDTESKTAEGVERDPSWRNPSAVAETIKRVEREMSNRKFKAFSDREAYSTETRRLPWESDAVLEKVSHNSGTTWSTNTLKTIVDDLLLKDKAIKDLRKRGKKELT